MALLAGIFSSWFLHKPSPSLCPYFSGTHFKQLLRKIDEDIFIPASQSIHSLARNRILE
jgi:hypothetical protein